MEFPLSSQENTFASVFKTPLLTSCYLIDKETQIQVLSYNFWEIFQKSLLVEDLQATASSYFKLVSLKINGRSYEENYWERL